MSNFFIDNRRRGVANGIIHTVRQRNPSNFRTMTSTWWVTHKRTFINKCSLKPRRMLWTIHLRPTKQGIRRKSWSADPLVSPCCRSKLMGLGCLSGASHSQHHIRSQRPIICNCWRQSRQLLMIHDPTSPKVNSRGREEQTHWELGSSHYRCRRAPPAFTTERTHWTIL